MLARVDRFLDHPAILPGLVIAGAVFVVFQVMGTAAGQPFAAYEVHSYWLAGGSEHPYANTIASGFDDTVNLYKYRYPPPLAQIFVVLHLLPFPLVAGLWIGMLYAIASAMSRLTLPRSSSASVGGNSRTNGAHRPPITSAIA